MKAIANFSIQTLGRSNIEGKCAIFMPPNAQIVAAVPEVENCSPSVYVIYDTDDEVRMCSFYVLGNTRPVPKNYDYVLTFQYASQGWHLFRYHEGD